MRSRATDEDRLRTDKTSVFHCLSSVAIRSREGSTSIPPTLTLNPFRRRRAPIVVPPHLQFRHVGPRTMLCPVERLEPRTLLASVAVNFNDVRQTITGL